MPVLSVKRYVIFSLITICCNLVQAQCPATIPTEIDTIIVTESRCQTTGTALVKVKDGAAPYTYSIISGPVLTPPQSGNLLQSLSSGDYVVKVTDNCNQSVTQNFTIPGSYTLPLFSGSTLPPSCYGVNDGSITLNVTGGRPPFSYSLVSPPEFARAAQISSTFKDLSAGNYTCMVTDSCGNFQTREIRIYDTASSFTITLIKDYFIKPACDSFGAVYSITPKQTGLKIPYVINLILPGGNTISHTVDSSHLQYGILKDTFYFKYHHIKGALDIFQIYGYDKCGRGATNVFGFMKFLDLAVSTRTAAGCTFQYVLDSAADAYNKSQNFCPTTTYTLISPNGVVLATQINNSSFSGYPDGNNYKVIREDCCSKDSITFNWKQTAPIKLISNYFVYGADKTGTAILNIFSSTQTKGMVIIASGPPSINLPDGTSINCTYPDTIPNVQFNIAPYGAAIKYFTMGTYKIYAIDTCGQKDSLTFMVGQYAVRYTSITAQAAGGCVGKNSIQFDVFGNGFGRINLKGYEDDANVYNYTGSLFVNNRFTISDLPSGSYYINYILWDGAMYRLKGMSGLLPDTINYTRFFPKYIQPKFAGPPAIAVCNDVRNVILLPDSSTGLAPFGYRFKISAGPIETSWQESPLFTDLTKGTYTFMMEDLCHNSFSSSVTIDTLALPAISTIGNTCEGGMATFTAPDNPYYSYSWQLPNGTTSNSNSITVDPVTPADTGMYKIDITSSVNGCVDHSSQSLRLSFCFIIPVKLINFSGVSNSDFVSLNWETTNEINSSYFIVEKSVDGITYSPVVTINAARLNFNSYQVKDMEPFLGNSFYRLKNVDIDGSYTYSKVISIHRNKEANIFINPNPVINTLKLEWYSNVAGNVMICITDVTGRVLITKQATATKGMNNRLLHIESLAAGTYILLLKENSEVRNVKFVKYKQ